MSNQNLTVRPLSSAIGAEILGVDLSSALEDSTFARIREAFDQHLVVFFRDQHFAGEKPRAEHAAV